MYRRIFQDFITIKNPPILLETPTDIELQDTVTTLSV